MTKNFSINCDFFELNTGKINLQKKHTFIKNIFNKYNVGEGFISNDICNEKITCYFYDFKNYLNQFLNISKKRKIILSDNKNYNSYVINNNVIDLNSKNTKDFLNYIKKDFLGKSGDFESLNQNFKITFGFDIFSFFYIIENFEENINLNISSNLKIEFLLDILTLIFNFSLFLKQKNFGNNKEEIKKYENIEIFLNIDEFDLSNYIEFNISDYLAQFRSSIFNFHFFIKLDSDNFLNIQEIKRFFGNQMRIISKFADIKKLKNLIFLSNFKIYSDISFETIEIVNSSNLFLDFNYKNEKTKVLYFKNISDF